MRISRWGAVLAIAVLFALQSPQKDASAQVQGLLDGSFARSRAATDESTFRAAIDRALASVPADQREGWRLRLGEMARPPALISLRRADGSFSVQQGDSAVLRSPDSGATVTVDGGYSLDQRITNGVLVQRVRNSDVTETLRHTLSADGRTLTLEIRIESAQFATPVTFQVTYARR